MEAEVGIEPA